MNTSKNKSKKASLILLAVVVISMAFASCGGHKLCNAYGGKTNTNSESMH